MTEYGAKKYNDNGAASDVHAATMVVKSKQPCFFLISYICDFVDVTKNDDTDIVGLEIEIEIEIGKQYSTLENVPHWLECMH